MIVATVLKTVITVLQVLALMYFIFTIVHAFTKTVKEMKAWEEDDI